MESLLDNKRGARFKFGLTFRFNLGILEPLIIGIAKLPDSFFYLLVGLRRCLNGMSI